MSSQVFTAVILNAKDASVEALLQALKSKNTTLECMSAYPDVVSGADISLVPENEGSKLEIETGSSVDFDFFEHVYQSLKNSEAQIKSAALFSSSTGTTHVFETEVDMDIELEDKNIVFLGEFEEELDEMLELVEGANVQDAVDESTEILIIGVEPDPEQHALAKEHDITILSEEDFWALNEVFN